MHPTKVFYISNVFVRRKHASSSRQRFYSVCFLTSVLGMSKGHTALIKACEFVFLIDDVHVTPFWLLLLFFLRLYERVHRSKYIRLVKRVSDILRDRWTSLDLIGACNKKV